MRTIRQIRREEGIPIPQNPDSQYRVIKVVYQIHKKSFISVVNFI
jgi:hypothetical protein